MVKGFWKTIKKPIFVLAPMADVTDAAFRHIIAKYGKPDVLWTEFVACDGLCSDKGRKRLLIDLKFDKSERPIIAQLFSSRPDHMEECARLIEKLGFDGLDINMGCPDKTIEKQGAGAVLIKNPKLAAELIAAAKRGAGDMPVSVKTRIGYNTNILESWLPILLEAEPAAITIHARTRKEMSKVNANWDTIGEAVSIARKYDSSPSRTLILGNGDVQDIKDAEEKVKKYGVDGVMLGRAIFGNPWLFSRKYEGKEIPIKERLVVMVEHTKLFEKMYKGVKRFDVMKKHYKAYASE
ncbi:MAG: tRNA-dihydrouridine synthase, partial [Patescibacteria group bacterium]